MIMCNPPRGVSADRRGRQKDRQGWQGVQWERGRHGGTKARRVGQPPFVLSRLVPFTAVGPCQTTRSVRVLVPRVTNSYSAALLCVIGMKKWMMISQNWLADNRSWLTPAGTLVAIVGVMVAILGILLVGNERLLVTLVPPDQVSQSAVGRGANRVVGRAASGTADRREFLVFIGRRGGRVGRVTGLRRLPIPPLDDDRDAPDDQAERPVATRGEIPVTQLERPVPHLHDGGAGRPRAPGFRAASPAASAPNANAPQTPPGTRPPARGPTRRPAPPSTSRPGALRSQSSIGGAGR